MKILTKRKPQSTSEKFAWSRRVETMFYKFFRIITVGPISFQQSSSGIRVKFEKKSRILVIIVIIFVFFYFLMMICLRIWVYPRISVLNVWSVVTNISLTFLTTLIILIETQFTAAYLTEMLFLKQKTENDLRTLCNNEQFEHEKYSSVNIYMRMLAYFLMLAFLVDILSGYGLDNLSQFYCRWLFFPRIFNRFRSFQHRLITGTLYSYIKLVRIKVEECINNIERNESAARQQKLPYFTMDSKRIFNDLNLSMRIFTSISRMTYLVNNTFRVSLFMVFFQDFMQLLTHTFWIYSKLFRQDLDGIFGIFC